MNMWVEWLNNWIKAEQEDTVKRYMNEQFKLMLGKNNLQMNELSSNE